MAGQINPAPWRIEGGEVVDADGGNVMHFDANEAADVAFWQRIVEAINLADRARDRRAGGL